MASEAPPITRAQLSSEEREWLDLFAALAPNDRATMRRIMEGVASRAASPSLM